MMLYNRDGPDMVFKTDSWTKYQFNHFLEQSGESLQIVKQGSDKIYSIHRFAKEVYHRLYSYDVQKLNQIKPENKWAVKLHEELENLKEWKQLRMQCRGDSFASGKATIEFLKQVIDNLPEKKLEDPEIIRNQIRGLMEFAKSSPEIKKQVDTLRKSGKSAVDQALQFAESLDPIEVRQLFRKSLKHTSFKIDKIREQVEVFAGEDNRQSDEIKTRLAEEVGKNRKLKRLAELAGRMKRIASNKQKSKTRYSRSEIADITLGADTDRLLPVEIVKLVHPILKYEFYRKFYENNLMEYKLIGKEPLSKGPIVICIDCSSSMEGKREVWTKAVALALLQIAVKQKRFCRLIQFNSDIKRIDDFNPGEINPLQLLDCMNESCSGGTNFEKPLKNAAQAIISYKHLKQADIIFISDGEDYLSDDKINNWNELKKKHEFSTHSVYISDYTGTDSTLKKFSDIVLSLNDLADDIEVTNTLFSF